MAHVDAHGKDDHNLQNCTDHDYIRSSDAHHTDTSGATGSANFFSTTASVSTPVTQSDTRNPLSNSTNDVNVNNSSPQQSNVINDTNSVVMALIEQNRLLMEQLLLRRSTTSSPSVQSNISNGYYVMPDFHETLSNFIGTESNTEASNWIKSLNSTADLHNWPDSFKLEIIRTKFKGAAHNWYLGRTFPDWDQFEKQFRETFIGTQTSIVERTKLLIARHQRKSETIIEYFHDKARMCRELELSFCESKQQIAEGLYSRELCLYLLSRSHVHENELLNDIITFMKINDSRNTRFKNSNRLSHPESLTKTSHSQPEVATKPSTSDMNSKQSAHKKKTRCFNCGSFDHISTGCTQPKRQPGSCFACGSIEHQITTCPQGRSKSQAVKTQNSSNSTAMILHPKDMVTPAYFINIDLRIADKYVPNVLAVIDTGSPVSLLKENLYPLECIPHMPSTNSGIVGINGSELIILDQSFVDVYPPDSSEPINIKLNIVPNNTINHDCLLGRNFLSHPRVLFTINDGKFEIEFKRSDVIPFNDIYNLEINNERSDIKEPEFDIETTLPYDTQNKIKDVILTKYINLDTTNHELNTVNVPFSQIKIELKDPSVFYFNPRRLSYFEKNKLQDIIDNLLKNKIIRSSCSEFSSPIVLVKKKNGELRLCIDYRELNKRTVRDRYPLPLIDDHLDTLRDKCYFTCIDLKDGFHHIEVEENSRKFTSFTTPLGQYEYCKMPFGLCNGPSKFQRYVNNIFSEHIKAKKVVVYFDDIVIATKTVEAHLEILSDVLSLMKLYKLQIRFDKSQFLKKEIVYLGYLVNASGVRPNPRNISVILNYPIPCNQKALHSFIGLASYFRRFIPNFSTIAKPLYDLLKKDTVFVFGEDKLAVFETIKQKLSEQPILCLYNPNAETELHCDASSLGFGSILFQKQSDNKFHPVFYFSQRTTSVQSRYHSYELEMLAIINSIKRFHVYLQGIKFKIITDCNSITLTLKKKDINPRIARWALFLQNYDYEIQHRSSNRMQHVDALSRNHHILVLEGCTFNQMLAINQCTDPAIKEIYKSLVNSENQFYELRNGLVYRKSDARLLFYVPANMRDQVIRSCHDDMGHVGINRTIELIKRVYWFPKMNDYVKSHIENCLKCIVFSPKVGKTEGFLKLIEKGTKPFHTIHIDHYGPLNKTVKRFRHIFVVVDAFTKFLTLYPVRTVNTQEACSKLVEYFSYYSKPIRIVSDRGSCFTSHAFKEFCVVHDIKHVLIAAGSPQANGQVERYNHTLKVMLSKILHEKDQNWNQHLNKVQFAINNTFNRTIKNTPSNLLFGINQHGDTHDYLRLILESDNKHNNERDLDKIRQVAQDNNLDSQIKNKAYYDSGHRPAHQYSIGDLVMIKNIDTTTGYSKKHIPKFKGPYKIKKALGNDRYVLTDVEGFQVTQIPFNSVYESKNMKPWIKI